MLPHAADRPVSMQRFPQGIDGKGFFHKDAPDHFPDWIKRVEVPKAGGTVTHVLITNADSLVYLVGQNTITPHVWLSRADRSRSRTGSCSTSTRHRAPTSPRSAAPARVTGELLRELGLAPFAQVTGSKGIHVWAPLRRRAHVDDVKELARRAAQVLAERHPEELTTEFRKNKREGRILVDVLRNGYAQTAVPPYAVRPRRGAPVATPIDWDELSDSRLRPDRWTLQNVLRRLAAKGDPWAGMQAHARGIGHARIRVDAMLQT